MGQSFTKQRLSALLKNVLYKGCIVHKGAVHTGEQEPIVEAELWEKVNRMLTRNGSPQQGRKHHRQQVLLAGWARCGECGAELKARFTTRQGQRHVYYVCTAAPQSCRQRPVAAPDLEGSLRRQLEAVLGPQPSTLLLQQSLERVRYSSVSRSVQVSLRDGTAFSYALEVPHRRGVSRDKTVAQGRIPRISRLLALAIKLETLAGEGTIRDYTALAAVGHISKPRLTQILNLTLLAPDIQETLLFLPKTLWGPDRITERQMRPVLQAADWRKQRQLFAELTRAPQQ